MDISEADLNKHCYLNTVNEGKTTFSIIDQKRSDAIRILQERCGFPSDKDFIHTLEWNSIEGVDFGRRDVNIANKIYGYSKGTAMGRFKHTRKGIKMDRRTEDITTWYRPESWNVTRIYILILIYYSWTRKHSYWQYLGTSDLSIVDLCLLVLLNKYRMQWNKLLLIIKRGGSML